MVLSEISLILVFYCYITNYYKFNGFKQHLLVSGFIGQKSGQASVGSLIRISQAEIKVLAGLGSYLEFLGEAITSKLILIVCRIHFLVVVGLTSPFSY